MLSTILTRRDKGALAEAVVYDCSAQHANAQSPDPEALVAMTPLKFRRAFPGAQIPAVSAQPTTNEMKGWIKKIEAAPKPKHGGWKGKTKQCSDTLNTDKINLKKSYWQLATRTDVKDLIASAAKKRGLTTIGMVETILIDWLNRNELKKIPRQITRSTNKVAYTMGQIAAKEYETFGNVSFEGYLFEVPGKKLTALKKFLISSGKFTEDIVRLYEAMSASTTTTRLSFQNYIWFFAGFCGIDWAVIAEQKI